MNQTFKEAIEHRRTYYSITRSSPISDEEIQQMIDFTVRHVPSAFNSQSTRVVLLLKEHHEKLWKIVKEELQAVVSADRFRAAKEKIEGSFECGYGTILFFEDQEIVFNLQKSFPSYRDYFPVWSEQTSGMHQFTLWTLLEEAGFGASLQHYAPLIDQRVYDEWNLNPQWKLIAQMPFGTPAAKPGEKAYEPLESRVLTFK